MNCFKNLGNVVLIAHNGRVFDFRVLSYAICKVGMVNEFSNHVLAFVDSLLLLRSKVPNLSSYGQKLINSFYGTVASIKLSPHRLFLFRFFSGIFKSDHYWFSLLLKQ